MAPRYIVRGQNKLSGTIRPAGNKNAALPILAATLLADVSSTAADTRASLSWDGSMMVFGSARTGGEGMADIYVTTRPQKVPHGP